jgi:hypothetical protein
MRHQPTHPVVSPAAIGLALLPVFSALVTFAANGATAPARGKAQSTSRKPAPARVASPAADAVAADRAWRRSYSLKAGETVSISVHLDRPSALPDNGRVGITWKLERAADPTKLAQANEAGGRDAGAFGIYTRPTADWRKTLHALDPDVYLNYRAPMTGDYSLTAVPIVEGPHPGAGGRWREKGTVPDLFPLPGRTPWPAGVTQPISVAVEPVALGDEAEVQRVGGLIEAEPNDTPEQAQRLELVPNQGVRTYEITGTADDIEFFDNGQVGQSGDDWFRLELKGTERKLVTAQLGFPGQAVAARIRCYALKAGAAGDVARLGDLLPIEEFTGRVNPERPLFTEGKKVDVAEGMDPNERTHQQDEQHRTNISRIFEPGRVYFLRVEANAPGYQLQVRVLPPAPYTDPRMAVRQAMYTHIGQVDAWLTNRPRGASVERRIRDSGNLLGTQCMSCHTQSGVWGPAVPVRNGYRVENVQSFWHLVNVMYECLRPTNELKDAANNTSLAPLDIGDGPAGTRAAGFNIVNAEQVLPARKLHSKQQVRTANFVLQTADPGGINAAGPGSNIGRNIVWLFASEILLRAWQDTGDPRYFRALEEKARNVLKLEPKFTDDVAVRMDYFGRLFPLATYPEEARRAADAERAAGGTAKGNPDEAAGFVEAVRTQLAADEARLRAIQREDGMWGFDPGTTPDGGRTWKPASGDWDPSPTALAITGLAAVGCGPDDPAVATAVKAMLARQDANGRWNRAAITGFVSTAYSIRALARLYPETPVRPIRAEFVIRPADTLLSAVRRIQNCALTGDPAFTDLLVAATRHRSPLVRYWAMVGLGGTHQPQGVPGLLQALRDPAKPVRDAATWALRQTLLDDHGWDAVLTAAEKGDDYTRAQVMQALGMRADAVMPKSTVDFARLASLLDRAMNQDPDPATRAWAGKAAWQWWVWNPPVRAGLNEAWVSRLSRPESNVLAENALRYSSQALFIANGHKANGSREHQYKELAALFDTLRKRLETAEPETKALLARRLVGVAGTFYQTSGGDGGPGQMGYVTPGSGALMGQAVLVYLRDALPAGSVPAIRTGLEGAANIPHGPLQEFLINYALKAPEELRKEAAAAVSDPRSAMLQASVELVEPLIQQVRRGATEPPRRPRLSDPVIQLFSSVNWLIPKDEEQQRFFFDLIIPRLERHRAPEEIQALPDQAAREAAKRDGDADWYLADRLGDVVASNPDLHHDMVFARYFPTELKNPLQRHFWVRSVPWILEHKTPIVAAPPALLLAPPGAQSTTPPKVDPALVTKDRALQLYLDALTDRAPAVTRAAAIRVSNTTSVRRNPEVLLALARLPGFEKDEKLLKLAENVVKQGSARFVPDVEAALKAETRSAPGLDASGKPDPAFLEDLTYFRDYVVPELVRVKRSDQLACMACHGLPGRVPSFYLKPADEFGYLNAADLLFDYREMQTRVNLQDLDRSKVLRKPLNVQDGKEDGHQGGRRYLPTDEGYLAIRKWVENQPRLLQKLAAPPVNPGTAAQ